MIVNRNIRNIEAELYFSGFSVSGVSKAAKKLESKKGTNQKKGLIYFSENKSVLFLASESLGSASEMLNNFVATLEPANRKTAIWIAQLVMLSELALNQALDHVEVKS